MEFWLLNLLVISFGQIFIWDLISHLQNTSFTEFKWEISRKTKKYLKIYICSKVVTSSLFPCPHLLLKPLSSGFWHWHFSETAPSSPIISLVTFQSSVAMRHSFSAVLCFTAMFPWLLWLFFQTWVAWIACCLSSPPLTVLPLGLHLCPHLPTSWGLLIISTTNLHFHL